jgi:hypothetical protein
MQTGPKIKLDVNLHRMDKYFPLDFDIEGGYDYDRIIDRKRFDDIARVLKQYKVTEDHIIKEFCFIQGWIERETGQGNGDGITLGKYEQMSLEIEELKDYLMKHRIKSVTFRGEYERTKTGEDFTMNEAINIDRICDGLRIIFKDEFDSDPARRRSRGLRAWQRRKMIRIRNNFLNYFTTIPQLDELELEEQKELIDQLTGLVGLGEER